MTVKIALIWSLGLQTTWFTGSKYSEIAYFLQNSLPSLHIAWILYVLCICITLDTRGDVSFELFFPSGDMSNLAYIGAKNLNFWSIKGYVYFETNINKSCYWSKIQIFGANVG